MTIPVSNVDVTTDTFGSWLQKTNQLAGIITANAVTVDTTAGGSVSTGNGFVNGIFGACTIVASVIRGSNVATSGPLIIDCDLTVNGSVTYNTINLGTDLIPIANNTYKVGSSSNTWNAGYFTNVFSNTATIGGFTVSSTGYSGTANNSLNLGGVSSSSYVNTSGVYTITGAHTYSANITLNSRLIAGGGSGTSGQVLKSTGTGVEWGDVSTSGNTTPAGSNTEVQFNNSGSLGANSNFTYNTATGRLSVPTTIVVGNSSVNVTINTTAFSGSVDATNITGTIPSARLSGTYNITANNASFLGGVAAASYLTTTSNYTISGAYTFSTNITLSSGLVAGGVTGTAGQVLKSTGTGVEWGSITVGVSAAAGSNTHVQFNDNGALGGDTGLTYNKVTDNLTVGNTIIISTGSINSTSFSGTANNASYLGGQLPSYYRDAGNMNAGTLPSARLTGSYNITAFNANNSTYLNGQLASFYTNASNMSSGTLPSGRLSGTYDIIALNANNSTNLGGQSSSYYRDAGNLNAGLVPTARLASGVASNTVYLRGDQTWAAVPSGTVTSVALSGGTTGLTVSGSPITTNGTITLAGTLAVENGGTNATTASGARTSLGTVAKAGDVFTGQMVFNSGMYANGSTFRISQNSTDQPGYLNGTQLGGAWEHNTRGSTIYVSRNQFACIRLNLTADDNIIEFFRTGTAVGGISVTSTSTAYNTSSDYRLKDELEPLVGAVDAVLSTPVYKFRWKATPDAPKVTGFLAHEAQQAVPEAVRGVKDGTEMQAIDQSKLVPMLWAAVQELAQRVELLEAQLNN